MIPYSLDEPKTGMPSTTSWILPMLFDTATPDESRGTDVFDMDKNPGICCKNATVFSRPPAHVIDPIKTISKAKNIIQP